MRTNEQIHAEIKASAARDAFFGFEAEVYMNFLPFEEAKQYLKPEYVALPHAAEDWKKTSRDNTETEIKRAMANYMDFAWQKVEDHRGISASRSVMKMRAFLWLLGDDEGIAAMEAVSYAQYGAPMLAVVCKRYDLPIPESEGIARMIQGESCTPDCEDGCGR